jgi:hypothetical protein
MLQKKISTTVISISPPTAPLFSPKIADGLFYFLPLGFKRIFNWGGDGIGDGTFADKTMDIFFNRSVFLNHHEQYTHAQKMNLYKKEPLDTFPAVKNHIPAPS